MKLDTAPLVVSSLLLLSCVSACGDAKVPPQPGEAGGVSDAKAIADAKASSITDVAEAKAAEAKAAEAKAVEAKVVVPTDPKVERPGVDPSALYWASASESLGRTTIDIIDLADESLMKVAEEHGSPDGLTAAFPPTVTLPEGHALGDEWIVITTDGEKRGKTVAYGAYGGASEGHFIVVLDIAATGLTAPASAFTGPIPSLREAKPMVATKGPGKAVFEHIKDALMVTADPDARRALGRKPIAAKHVTVIEGSFPKGLTHLAALLRPLAPPDDIGAEHVAGMILVDATGRFEAVTPPVLSIDQDEFLYLVDLEGDGVDEVVYTDSYYEGSYTRIITWAAAGTAEIRTLTGDGA